MPFVFAMEETFRGMTFQAAPVSKPLGSVKRICAAGHRVVFHEDGSYIENKTTGEICGLSPRKRLSGDHRRVARRQVLAGSGDRN